MSGAPPVRAGLSGAAPQLPGFRLAVLRRAGLGCRLELLELAVQVALADPEDAGGLLAMALALLEHPLHVAALELLERDQGSILLGGAERGFEAHPERQVLGLDHPGVAQDERALD